VSISRRDFLKLWFLTFSVGACQKVGITGEPTPRVSPTLPPSSPTLFQPSPPSATSPSTETPIPPSATEQPTSTPTPEPTLVSPVFIIDGHQDIAWNALEFGRDPLLSAFVGRMEESGTRVQNLFGERISGYPEWLSGRIGIIFATLFVMPAQRAYGGFNAMTYASPKQAEECAKAQLDFYRHLPDREPRLKLVETRLDLDVVVDSWSQPGKLPLVGIVILMEGADPIISPDDVGGWFGSGLRMIGPAWHATRYAGGTGEPGPLTDLGRQLLEAMAKYNMILDLSHLARQAYLQAVVEYPGTVIASHSNPTAFLPTDRGLADDMIKLLAERDGVMGIMPYNPFLVSGWVRGQPRDLVELEIVAQAIDYVVQLTGTVRHVGIGSDFDGGFGLDSIPAGMESVADLGKIAEPLEKWGYTSNDIEAVMYKNWLRILQEGLPA
jgi:membrane dipeptidase